jgi:molybdopterin/thiamine biosynthesis adenylyltransferase
MDDRQLLRYSRHILLDDLGIEGQQRLLAARVLVVGAGGLGSAALPYLAAGGVGHLTVVDHDTVDLTNLQRQILHREDRIGWPKVESARASLLAINPGVEVTTVAQRADAAMLDALVAAADLVLDCSDNYPTRQAVNAACVRHRRALVSGAAVGFDGQVAVWNDPRVADSHSPQVGGLRRAPCYACLFPPDATVPEVACATMGVFAPLVGIIGTVQAAEALKWLAGCGKPLGGELLMLDARTMQWHGIRVEADPNCPVCGAAAQPSEALSRFTQEPASCRQNPAVPTA